MANVTYKVVKGDTLSGIAKAKNTTVDALLALNPDIVDRNRIYVGQVIIISGTAAPKTQNKSQKPKINNFGLQSDTQRTIYATWVWDKPNTDHYEVKWIYSTGDGVGFIGEKSNTTNKQALYFAPENANHVAFYVRPISKTYKQKDKDVNYWTAEWSTYEKYSFSDNPPSAPNTPSVELTNTLLTAKLDNITSDATSIQFQVVKDNTTVFKTSDTTIRTGHAQYSCYVDLGSEYKVRCRAIRDDKYSDWSAYSDNYKTKPSSVTNIITCKATSETSVLLAWRTVTNASKYEIDYTTEKRYFDTSSETTTIPNIEFTTYEVTGLESGKEYFFRIRAVNDQGESSWSEIQSIIIGKTPVAPTTWSSTTTCITGDALVLYWVHNSEDGSKETSAKLEITVNGTTSTMEFSNTTGSDENRYYTLNTSSYRDGTVIEWRVCTKGIVKDYGEWSIKRSITIYAAPTLGLTISNSSGENIYTLTSFPFFINGQVGPNTQTPISYHVSIVSNDSYETWDEIGNPKIVSKGDEVYSKVYDVNQDLLLKLTPNSIDLENNVTYIIKCLVTMNTGLTAEDSVNFKVSWNDVMYSPNAEISYNKEDLSMSIHPYCDLYPNIFYKVNYEYATGKFYRTDIILNDVSGNSINSCFTEDYDDIVYFGKTGNGQSVYFCVVRSEEHKLIENITLSVYRREYDGRFVEIATGLNNTDNTFVTDPHPSLDYARYRIVAISNDTGAVSFSDIPSFLIGEKAVIIQWDEYWTSFEASNEERQTEKPIWSGSMLKLPYNIDISDTNDIDVTMVEYIGRSHPVSYYGTQLGVTSTWNVEIDKRDKNTLYGLRKLAIYKGDVYVREPSGSGYWANVKVSFSQKHCELTIPVTLDITRVEGGI